MQPWFVPPHNGLRPHHGLGPHARNGLWPSATLRPLAGKIQISALLEIKPCSSSFSFICCLFQASSIPRSQSSETAFKTLIVALSQPNPCRSDTVRSFSGRPSNSHGKMCSHSGHPIHAPGSYVVRQTPRNGQMESIGRRPTIKSSATRATRYR